MNALRPSRLRRSQLAVPASSMRKIESAAASKADHVFLDLEDAVAPAAKGEARKNVVEAANRLDWTGKTLCVRVNDIGTAWCIDDVLEVVGGAGDRVDTLMIPKAASARDIHYFDTLLTHLETKHNLRRRIGLEALIEEAEALIAVNEIAKASPRMEALIFGMGDYSASHGIDIGVLTGAMSYPGDVWYLPRFMITCAARAAGLDAVDGPYASVRDVEGYRREASRARALGMAGKWALHPSQIDAALEIFTPDAAQVAYGRKISAAYAEAQARGEGAVEIDGTMVDVAVVRLFDGLLRRADLAGV